MNDGHGFVEVACRVHGVELHLELGRYDVAEILHDVCEDRGHDWLGVIAPDLAHGVEVVELKTEVVEGYDACGCQARLDELLFLVVGPGACFSIGGILFGVEDADQCDEVAIIFDFFS